eukprot:3302258-Amphidinium_carterae.1
MGSQTAGMMPERSFIGFGQVVDNRRKGAMCLAKPCRALCAQVSQRLSHEFQLDIGKKRNEQIKITDEQNQFATLKL